MENHNQLTELQNQIEQLKNHLNSMHRPLLTYSQAKNRTPSGGLVSTDPK